MQLFKMIVVIPGFLFAGICSSATEFNGEIPVDVVREMVSGEIYRDLPDNFPVFEMPDQLSTSGSVSTDFYTQAIFVTTASLEAGIQTLAESFLAEGWQQLPSVDYQPAQNGFVRPGATPSRFNRNNEYCHDRFGTLSITPGREDSANGHLSARLNQVALRQPGFSCQQQITQRERAGSRMGSGRFSNPNQAYMPLLLLPEVEDVPPAMGITGARFSSSGSDIETSARVAGDMSLDELYESFAEQLRAQGWSTDSDWSGDVMAGGNWIKSPTSELNFIGVLSIFERNAGIFELKFNMLSRGENASAASAGAFDIIQRNPVP